MQPELIEDWLRERLEWEFVAAENDALERAVKALINCDGVAEEFPAALDAIRALKHSEHVNKGSQGWASEQMDSLSASRVAG
jgi:hypothetical protein